MSNITETHRILKACLISTGFAVMGSGLFYAIGLILMAILLAGCSTGPKLVVNTDRVITAPAGAVDYCERKPEDILCN